MSVRACARTAAARLDTEQVVEQRNDEVVMQVASAWRAHHEGNDRQPFGVEVPENLDGRLGSPGLDGAAQVVLLVCADHIDTDGLLQLKDEAGADRFDDCGSATLLALRRVGEVSVFGRIDVRDSAA